MNLYKNILDYYNLLTSKQIFIYCVIFVILYIYLQNILIAAIVFMIIFLAINIYNSQYVIEENFIENELFPKSKFIEKNEEIKNFVYFIQDFYYYSPENYIEFISNLDTFLSIYEDILIDDKLAGKFYNLLEKKKFIILHYLDAIKINCPDDRNVIEKVNTNINEMENILNNYLYDVYERNNKYNKQNGFDINTKIIDLNLKYPYNETFLDD